MLLGKLNWYEASIATWLLVAADHHILIEVAVLKVVLLIIAPGLIVKIFKRAFLLPLLTMSLALRSRRVDI